MKINTQNVILKGSASILNCKEIHYISVKFRYNSPQQDSKLVRYIRNLLYQNLL